MRGFLPSHASSATETFVGRVSLDHRARERDRKQLAGEGIRGVEAAAL